MQIILCVRNIAKSGLLCFIISQLVFIFNAIYNIY